MIIRLQAVLAVAAFMAAFGADASAEERVRARSLGIAPGVLQPGPMNAITDIEGVKIGHVTLDKG